MNDLEKFFRTYPHRGMDKWVHYFGIYDKHFSKFRDQSPVVVEIGVECGGSLQMWKSYFGFGSKIIGIDINDKYHFSEDGIEVIIGDQGDKEFWKKFKLEYPRPHVLVDDGGHTMSQQITTFKEMYYFLANDGVYLCEDLHTSYREGFGGGPVGTVGTTVAFFKEFIDDINWESNKNLWFASRTHSINIYTDVIVFEKRKVCQPYSEQINVVLED